MKTPCGEPTLWAYGDDIGGRASVFVWVGVRVEEEELGVEEPELVRLGTLPEHDGEPDGDTQVHRPARSVEVADAQVRDLLLEVDERHVREEKHGCKQQQHSMQQMHVVESA